VEPLSQRGIRAAVEVAGELGVRCDEPVVLRDLTNLLVHLAPAPVVARVQTSTSGVREAGAVLSRAVDVTRYLVDAGAPVAGPSLLLPAGPHEKDGIYVSFWELHDHDPQRPVDDAAAGAMLRDVHVALQSYEGVLPDWDPLAEARVVLGTVRPGEDVSRLTELAVVVGERVQARALPEQPVHGDAHLGNLLVTPDGPLWTDWEMVHRGPRAWDLGALVIRARVPPVDPVMGARAEVALAGYVSRADGQADLADLDLMVDAYGLFQTAWWLAIDEQRGEAAMGAHIVERLEWWRMRSRAPREW
jgi:Phosphotransferase enzyme family